MAATVFPTDTNNIFLNSDGPLKEADLTATAADHKVDVDVLPGHILVPNRNGPANAMVDGVKRNSTANSNAANAVADIDIASGKGIDDAYVSADGTTAALWPARSRVRFRHVNSGDWVRVRVGTAAALNPDDPLATVAGGTDGQKVDGCVGAGTAANAWGYAKESVDQTNAHDQGLIWAEKA